jgi:hypothetical protein
MRTTNPAGTIMRCIVPALLGLQLAACAPPVRYYADADRSVAGYGEIKAGQLPTAMRVDVQYLRNGLPDDSDRIDVRDEVLRIVEKTGVVKVSEDPQTPALLSVVVDDIYEAAGKTDADMFYTGMLLGLRSEVASTDSYVFKISCQDGAGPLRFGRYQHAIWTTVGRHAPAPSVRGPYRQMDEAFSIVMEDVLLNFFKNLHQSSDAGGPLLFMQQPH